jgi:DNA-binding transcriptional LysR family regulator
MDKLRAIEYFVRTVESGSFGAAARALDVSTPAVTQLVAALERVLGVVLLHRSSRGVALTAHGERYYEVARMATSDLQEIERQLDPRGARPHGTLSVGMRTGVGATCVMPRVGRFLARYPEVELVVKPVETLAEISGLDVDLTVMTGWPPTGDFAIRMLAQTRNVVCASPEYWRKAGEPTEPESLLEHDCLVLRSSGGTLLDRWIFERGGERRTIDVKPRILSYHSMWIQAAARAGVGVIRVADFSVRDDLLSGALRPVLLDWEALEAPQHFVVYRPRQRQSRLVRVFVDFLVEIFAEWDRDQPISRLAVRAAKPDWFGRVQGRQSMHARRRHSPAR